MRWEEDMNNARWKICIPASMVDPILWYLHDARTGGHPGIKKTFDKAKLSPFYWKDMRGTVKLYVNQCEICEERKNPTIKKLHLLKSYVVGAPFERIATDIAGPFPTTKKGNRYILVVGDYFTKLTELYAMPDMKAETVADIIFRAWIKRYGCPIEIHSDQGRQYESDVFKETCQLLEINKTRTTPFHPRSDGMIERINRTVNDMLSKYIKRHQKDWDDHLDFIIMAYNESTGLTPHRLVYGREMTFPLDMITDPIGIEKDERKLTSEYVRILENNLKEGHEIVRKNLNAAAKRQIMTYEVKVRPLTYKVGDLVWRNQKRNAPGLKSKIVRYWTGPWVIVEKLSDITFKIKWSKNSPPVTVHGDILKKYKGNKIMKWFIGNEAGKTTITFPDVSSLASNAGSDTDDNQNPGCNFPLDNDGGNEAQ